MGDRYRELDAAAPATHIVREVRPALMQIDERGGEMPYHFFVVLLNELLQPLAPS